MLCYITYDDISDIYISSVQKSEKHFKDHLYCMRFLSKLKIRESTRS